MTNRTPKLGKIAAGSLAILIGASLASGLASRVVASDFEREDSEARDLVPGPLTSDKWRKPIVSIRPTAAAVDVGERVSFRVNTTASGFGHLYVINASGRVQAWMENVPISASGAMRFPTGGGIEASPPSGRDDVVLIVTRHRLAGFFGTGITREPRVVMLSPEAFKDELDAKLMALPRADWGAARTTVRVREDRRTAWGEASSLGWGWSRAPAPIDADVDEER